MARVYRFSPGATARAVYLPALLPYLLSAARVGLGFAWKAGIAGEVIAISSGSMGYRLYTAKTTLAMEDLFAWTGFILLLSFLLERGMVALMGLAARRLAPTDIAGLQRLMEEKRALQAPDKLHISIN